MKEANQALRSGGQFMMHIAHFLAHLIPDTRRFLGGCGFLDNNKHDSFSGFRVTADVVQPRGLLQFFLQLVGDLLLLPGRSRRASKP